MSDGAHHSIGEVLSLLKEEHADVTISKIRFLESQGLIEPERTPSGYRKFYDSDIERLRWILIQQRDNFLPLKVIKRRLEDAGFDPATDTPPRDTGPLPEPTLFAKRDPDPTESSAAGSVGSTVDLRDSVIGTPPPDVGRGGGEPPAPSVESPAAVEKTADRAPAPLTTAAGSVSMSAGELADAVGADLGFIGELEKLGLIMALDTETGAIFDHEALIVAKAAVDLHGRGLEPRHLRMFKVAADREAGVFQQIIGPHIKKGGAAEQRGWAELDELVRLGETIHRSILRRGLNAPPP